MRLIPDRSYKILIEDGVGSQMLGPPKPALNQQYWVRGTFLFQRTWPMVTVKHCRMQVVKKAVTSLKTTKNRKTLSSQSAVGASTGSKDKER